MKNHKRIVMVSILLIIVTIAVSAAPLMRNNKVSETQPRHGYARMQESPQAVEQNKMLQEQKELIEARRTEALQRQEAVRAQAIGQGFRGQGRGNGSLQ
jgi:hypothetical protein